MSKKACVCPCGNVEYTVVWHSENEFETPEYCPFCGIMVEEPEDDDMVYDDDLDDE